MSYSGSDRFLVTEPNLAVPQGEPGALRIGIITTDDPTPQILTSSMWTASSPSLAFDGQRFLFTGRKLQTDRDGIWEMEISGAGLRLITEGNGAPASPVYLPDGRIIYSDVPSAVDKTSRFTRSIYSCAPDGSDRRRLTFGNHRDERPSVLADGRVLFKRVFNQQSLAVDSLQMTIHPDGAGFSRFTGSVVDQDVVKILTRARPPILTSVLKASMSTGTLLCLNVYTSRLATIKDLQPGMISEVRISVLGPSTKGQADSPAGHVAHAAIAHDPNATPIGSAPVFEDGSFQVGVPADVPLQLTLLRKDGTVAATLASGIWVRPNETRGCIGCHENPNLAPVNRLPIAVTQPVTQLTWESGSAGSAPASGGGA